MINFFILWAVAIILPVLTANNFFSNLSMYCSHFFLQAEHPIGGTILYIMHKLMKYFVPQLTICVIFAPLKSRPPSVDKEFEETDTLSWANRPVSCSHVIHVYTVDLHACAEPFQKGDFIRRNSLTAASKNHKQMTSFLRYSAPAFDLLRVKFTGNSP